MTLTSNVFSLPPESDFRPSAARLIDSLRDTGYNPEAAFADIIDNSIAAGATQIIVELSCLFGDVRISFLDNGFGMSESELLSAMRYGSPKRHDPKSLGKFGMGLKTASTAFCQRLVVLSQKNGNTAIRAWDLDTIRATDLWQLETPAWTDYPDEKADLGSFAEQHGAATMVIWEKVDRLISHDSNNKLDTHLKNFGRELCEELSAVFFKFLDHSNDQHPNITITMKIGDEPAKNLEPWDPLCLFLNKLDADRRVQPLPKKTLKAALADNTEASFTVTGSILPSQSQLNSDELSQVRYTLDNQGFYIFREGRLIWHEGWPPRMYKKEGKMTRLRVTLDFTHELDDLFRIDFRKSRIIIPPIVREKLKEIVAPWRNHTLKTTTVDDSESGDNRKDAAITRHQRATNAIDRHSEHTKVAEVRIEGNKASLRNKYNIIPIDVDGVHIYPDTHVRVREEDSLEGNILWSSALDHEGEVCVQLGRSHPYFERLYATCKEQPDAIMALDMLLWTLANAEFGVWSESNKTVIREFRQQVSSSLNHLCQELPDPTEV